MTRINMHISKAKLLFYPPCEVKCRLQNGVSTSAPFFLLRLPSMWISYARTSCGGLRIGIKKMHMVSWRKIMKPKVEGGLALPFREIVNMGSCAHAQIW